MNVLLLRLRNIICTSWGIRSASLVRVADRRLNDTIDQLEMMGIPTNNLTYAHLIRQCGDVRSLFQAKRLHAHIVASGYGKNRFLSNLLVQMYGKCGSLEDASMVFWKTYNRNLFSWSIMIAAYVQNGYGEEVLELFHGMELEGIKPDTVTFSTVLGGCSNAQALKKGKALHSRIADIGYGSNIVVSCALVNMYGKCGAPDEARIVFENMERHDIVSWNALLSAYAHNEQSKEALVLYQRMQKEGFEADNITFVIILYACSCLEALEFGKEIHASISQSRIDEDASLGNALITMYYSCHKLDEAYCIFEKMSQKDNVTWNAMITACAQQRDYAGALEMYHKMDRDGIKPDRVTFMCLIDACSSSGALKEGKAIHERIAFLGYDHHSNIGTALVNMYGKCGDVDSARKVFEEMPHKTIICWTAMIVACSQNKHEREALKHYKMLRELKLKLDSVVLISVIDACTSLGVLQVGKELHSQILDDGFRTDTGVGNALITMYNKCGGLIDARKVFSEMINKNIISWNAMIAAYCEHGDLLEAVELFMEMGVEGGDPDDATFVSILFACSHAGLFEKGWQYFLSMTGDYRDIVSKVDHYACIVDLLGRTGRLDEAEELILSMPFKADAAVWNILLGACRIHNNTDRGERISKKIIQMNPAIPGPYVLLSNMYSAIGRWKDAARVRRAMEANCSLIQSGTTFIEV